MKSKSHECRAVKLTKPYIHILETEAAPAIIYFHKKVTQNEEENMSFP